MANHLVKDELDDEWFSYIKDKFQSCFIQSRIIVQKILFYAYYYTPCPSNIRRSFIIHKSESKIYTLLLSTSMMIAVYPMITNISWNENLQIT